MLRLTKYLKPYLWLIVILVVLVYLQVQANLELPNYMAKIIDAGIIGGDMQAIYHNGLLMLVFTLAGGVAAIGVGFLATKIATGLARDLRNKVFTKVENFSAVEFNKFSTASLITRSTNDVQQVQTVMTMLLRVILMAPFMAVVALQNALRNAPELSWIIAIAVIVLLGLIIVLLVFGLPKFKILQKLVDRLNLVTREGLTGLRVVRAFNNESIEEKKFDDVNQELTQVNIFVNRLMSILQPFMAFVLNLATIAIVWFGAHLISENSIEIGGMMAFMQYAIQVITSFLMLSMIFVMVPRASVSANRIIDVIDTEISIEDPEKPVAPTKNGHGQVEFRDVTFTYPDADYPVLSGINFVAKSGQTTAFIGSTGSGKSTLINLISRFYDVTAGQILIDGIDIRNFKLKDLYSQIGYVPQKGVLFSGTVNSNIKFGNKNASKKEVQRALIVAQANEFVKKMTKGTDSHIAQGGSNVSGGQKQRLSIARALIVKPNIYIFDDSFSALDLKTDAVLRKELFKETRGKTVLIVGQRISTIMGADQIIVLDEGKIVGQGTHDELLKNNLIYQEIASSQLSKEELNSTQIKNKGIL